MPFTKMPTLMDSYCQLSGPDTPLLEILTVDNLQWIVCPFT